MMEDATITQESTQEMYSQGKYPSVIDTDDLVFELGKQLIGNLNKEKLLDSLLQKGKLLEQMAIEAKKASIAADKRKEDLEESNKRYLKNNQKLDEELVRLRGELSKLKEQHSLEIEELGTKLKQATKPKTRTRRTPAKKIAIKE